MGADIRDPHLHFFYSFYGRQSRQKGMNNKLKRQQSAGRIRRAAKCIAHICTHLLISN
jgi:hypothetical protein